MIAVVSVIEGEMEKLLATDELWTLVEPIVAKYLPSPKGGKLRVPDWVCLRGVLLVLKTGIRWKDFRTR